MRKAILCFLLVCSTSAYPQEPNIKFGKVSTADLEIRSYAIDTSAAAVIIYDNGSTKIKGKESWFALEFKIHRRIHILNKNGYDYANVTIPLYINKEDEEKLDNLRASTYNIENGKVVETKLDKNSVFREKKDKNHVIKKFTLPNVKEGSIIEYEYQITSDFLFNLQPWTFQGDIPRLWSEYRVTLPQFLSYILITQGNQQFHISDRKDKTEAFLVDQKTGTGYGTTGTETINITCGVTEFRWVMKDVAALKEEAFTSTPANYVTRLEFQLSGYKAPLEEKKIMTTWQDLASDILKEQDFGGQLEIVSTWLPDAMQSILQGASSETDKAKKIYTYIRDQFTCTDHSQLFPEQTLRNVFKNKNGGVAEINLLLTAMLRTAGINADPVILSTKRNGFIIFMYPVIGRFNYVVTRASIDGKEQMLDASYPQLGFGKLNYDCYNGKGRVLNASATEINMNSDQLTENGTLSVNMTGDKSNGWVVKVDDVQGYYTSTETRQKIRKQGENVFFNSIAKVYGNDVKIEQTSTDSLTRYEDPLTLHYTIKMTNEPSDIIYLDPIVAGKYKQNPFKSADRQYPVEMPYKINETYLLTLMVPEGFIIDEMPKGVKLKLNESDDAIYEYSISQSGVIINLRSRLQINRTLFQPSEYEALREFFNRIVAKQNEQIVLKKKS